MLPFVEIPALELGPLSIQPFGALTAFGVLFGTSMGAKYAAKYEYDDDDLRFIGMRVVVWGFIMCHLVDVFLYTPEKVKADPWVILRIWEGIASYGGILGAVIAFGIYSRLKKFDYLRYGDAVIYGFSAGMIFGRAGCAIAHDHLGVPTDFFLAVDVPKGWRLPDGTPGPVTAHDLGLYEMFVWLTLFVGLSLVMKFWTERKPGTIIAIGAFFYAPIRFGFEFLRFPESDPRYLGLTPAQHMALWTIAGGIWVLWRQRQPDSVGLELPEPGSKTRPKKSDKSEAKEPAKDSQSNKKKPQAKKKAKVVKKKRK